MYLKILIVTLILVALMMLALGVKLLFDKDATFTHHYCAQEDCNLNEEVGCARCELHHQTDCLGDQES